MGKKKTLQCMYNVAWCNLGFNNYNLFNKCKQQYTTALFYNIKQIEIMLVHQRGSLFCKPNSNYNDVRTNIRGFARASNFQSNVQPTGGRSGCAATRTEVINKIQHKASTSITVSSSMGICRCRCFILCVCLCFLHTILHA